MTCCRGGPPCPPVFFRRNGTKSTTISARRSPGCFLNLRLDNRERKRCTSPGPQTPQCQVHPRNGVHQPVRHSFQVRMARPVSCCGKEPFSCQGFLRKWFNRGTVFWRRGRNDEPHERHENRPRRRGPPRCTRTPAPNGYLWIPLRGNDGWCHAIPCVKPRGPSSGVPVPEPAHRAGSLSKGGTRYRDPRGTQGRAASPRPPQQATHSTARSLSLSKRRAGEPQTPRP